LQRPKVVAVAVVSVEQGQLSCVKAVVHRAVIILVQVEEQVLRGPFS
jgi:hypothetical protein